jgi:hypothetical protein
LQSTPVAERATRNAIGREWLAAILADGVEEIVWDHSRVGSDIELPGAGGRRLALGDTYSFSALTAVGRRRPDEVATAMAEVLAQ